ncbi:hypothetical protein [Gilvibacter sp.]|uniref:hypothetical protein n=1 Tax=Gilvibacter sp. TaxID=2729997 RepID=UPI003F49D0E4
MTPEEEAVIENQVFDRWDFEFRSVARNTILRNQVFRESSTLKIEAKEGIELQPGVELSPNASGGILLIMDPELEISCPEKQPENREVILPKGESP